MSTTRILTLFGEEVVNESAKPAAKSRVRTKETPLQEEDENSTSDQKKIDDVSLATNEVTANEITLFDTNIDDDLTKQLTDSILDSLQVEAASHISEYSKQANNDAEEIYSDVFQDEPIGSNSNNNSEPDSVSAYDTSVTQHENDFLQSATERIEEIPIALAEPKAEQARKATKTKKQIHNVEEIIPEDWNGEKKYYTIGEVADFFKVKTSHIRFWTNEFKLKVRTTRKGDRLYTPEQVKELRAIYHLTKERGFTISGAKAKLKTKNNMDVTTVDLKSSLVMLKTKLIALRKQMG